MSGELVRCLISRTAGCWCAPFTLAGLHANHLLKALQRVTWVVIAQQTCTRLISNASLIYAAFRQVQYTHDAQCVSRPAHA